MVFIVFLDIRIFIYENYLSMNHGCNGICDGVSPVSVFC